MMVSRGRFTYRYQVLPAVPQHSMPVKQHISQQHRLPQRIYASLRFAGYLMEHGGTLQHRCLYR